MHSDNPAADIAFGTGSSTAFVEKMRIKGSGLAGIGTSNPGTKLDIANGRLRFTGIAGVNTAHGIEFTNNAGTALRTFIGQYDDNTIGLYGYGGSAWGFLWDVNDATLRIGTTQKAAGYLLNVGGNIAAEEVLVQLRGSWPDYVFKKNYQLLPLNKLSNYIAENNHLPNIPAASEVKEKGMQLGDMQKKTMEKIEELTLYLLQMNERLEKLEKENTELKLKLNKIQ